MQPASKPASVGAAWHCLRCAPPARKWLAHRIAARADYRAGYPNFAQQRSVAPALVRRYAYRPQAIAKLDRGAAGARRQCAAMQETAESSGGDANPWRAQQSQAARVHQHWDWRWICDLSSARRGQRGFPSLAGSCQLPTPEHGAKARQVARQVWQEEGVEWLQALAMPRQAARSYCSIPRRTLVRAWQQGSGLAAQLKELETVYPWMSDYCVNPNALS